MTVEPQHLVTLDSAPSSQGEGPWAADVVIDTHGIRDERSARWLVAEDYRETLPKDSPFNAHSYTFVVDNDTFVYVQECDVDEILLLREVVDGLR